MYAIIQARGRQIKVSPGAVIEVDGTAGEAGAEFTFEQVLLVEGTRATSSRARRLSPTRR